MRKAFLYIIAIALATSCSIDLMDSSEMGSISLSLYSDVEVVADTKADAYDCSEFLVDIYGTTYFDSQDYASPQYVYGDMPASIEIPFGYYHVSAQNCTAADAESGYGKVRFFGESQEVEVLSYSPVSVTVSCKMTNGKTTMTFDESFTQDFKNISVAFTVGDRTVTLAEGQNDLSEEVYFNVPEEGSDLVFRITGTVASGTDQEREVSYTNAESPVVLTPGKWAKFNIKSNHNGSILPGIDVNDEMDSDNRTELIDPEGGVENGDISSISLLVDTYIDDATVVDCVIDIY